MPLLDPAECILLLVNVRSVPVTGFDTSPVLRPRDQLINAAALAASVPRYAALRNSGASIERRSAGALANTFGYPSGMTCTLWAQLGLSPLGRGLA